MLLINMLLQAAFVLDRIWSNSRVEQVLSGNEYPGDIMCFFTSKKCQYLYLKENLHCVADFSIFFQVYKKLVLLTLVIKNIDVKLNSETVL